MSLAARREQDDFLAFCEGVRRLTGIDLTQYKRPQMERRIRSFAGRRGIESLPAYLALLSAEAPRLEEFLDRVTINVSQLWRNPEQFARVADTILPKLAEAGRIRCWSAGCSYGAEAFTLAALCKTVAPSSRVEVHGHDIDARMVERARAGRFSEDDVRSAPGEALSRWFVRLPGGGWEAKPELRMVTRFSKGDLLRDRFPADHYDLVLCRNVVIYFTEEVRDRLHARLAASVRPGGYLMIGSSERVSMPSEIGLESAFPFIYRRVQRGHD
jgi:chemotaxis protein methyltransferase CheR